VYNHYFTYFPHGKLRICPHNCLHLKNRKQRVKFKVKNKVNVQMKIEVLKFIKSHKILVFTFLWLILICLIILRLDILIISAIGIGNWPYPILPITYFIIVYLILRKLKWYDWLAFIFTPVLQIFWFIPKMILHKGKAFLVLVYARFIIRWIVNFKKRILLTILIVLSIVLLLSTDYDNIRISCIIFYT